MIAFVRNEFHFSQKTEKIKIYLNTLSDLKIGTLFYNIMLKTNGQKNF